MVSGWTLLGIGMITVFIVLLSVVGIAKILIIVTNRIHVDSGQTTPTPEEIPNSIIALISAVVNQETNGRGQVVKIEQIKG